MVLEFCFSPPFLLLIFLIKRLGSEKAYDAAMYVLFLSNGIWGEVYVLWMENFGNVNLFYLFWESKYDYLFLDLFLFFVPCWNKRASLMEIRIICFDIFHLLYIPCLKNMCDSFLSVFAVYAMHKFSQLLKSAQSLAFFFFFLFFG